MHWWKAFVSSLSICVLDSTASAHYCLCPRRSSPGMTRACRFLPEANKISECVPPGTQICVQCLCSVQVQDFRHLPRRIMQ